MKWNAENNDIFGLEKGHIFKPEGGFYFDVLLYVNS